MEIVESWYDNYLGIQKILMDMVTNLKLVYLYIQSNVKTLLQPHISFTFSPEGFNQDTTR